MQHTRNQVGSCEGCSRECGLLEQRMQHTRNQIGLCEWCSRGRNLHVSGVYGHATSRSYSKTRPAGAAGTGQHAAHTDTERFV